MTPVVRALLLANVAMFVLQQTALAGLLYSLVFVPSLVLKQPWTIVTYMFLHGDLMHIAFNMLSLWFFGVRVEDRLGSRRFTTLFFLSGISGAALSMLFGGGAMLGASAGVFGVTMAFAYYWPHVQILIWGVLPVPARLMVIGTALISFWFGFGQVSDGIAHFAHLGGYVGAYLYLRWLDRAKGSFRRKATAAPVEAARKVESGGWKSIDLASIHEVNRDQVKVILDKISAKGIGSLTPQERLFLSNFVPVADDKVLPPQ